jgi:hypothetical protein
MPLITEINNPALFTAADIAQRALVFLKIDSCEILRLAIDAVQYALDRLVDDGVLGVNLEREKRILSDKILAASRIAELEAQQAATLKVIQDHWIARNSADLEDAVRQVVQAAITQRDSCKMQEAQILKLQESARADHDAPLCGHHASIWFTARNTLRPKSGCVACDVVQQISELEARLAQWKTDAQNVRRENERLEARIGALTEALMDYGTWNGSCHERSCPGDDTCSCQGKPINDAVNAALTPDVQALAAEARQGREDTRRMDLLEKHAWPNVLLWIADHFKNCDSLRAAIDAAAKEDA